jgi:hypothetical protein
MPNEDVGHFLSMVRFEQRAKLASLAQNLLEIHSYISATALKELI